MTQQEQKFIHFVSCIAWLNNAWRLLITVQAQSENPLRGAAFRFALVEYCTPYKSSRGPNKSKPLDTTFIPSQFHALHQRIITTRDTVYAHHDLTVMDAKLHIHEIQGQRYTQISQNYITGTEEFKNINEIITMLEGTLENMYVHEKSLEAELQP